MIPTRTAWINPLYNNLDDQIIAFVKGKNPARPLKLVVSVTEEDELAGVGFMGVTMVSPEDWKKKGVAHHLLKIADFTAHVSNRAVIDTIFLIRDVIEKGGSVYIHCKAGRSRSIMTAAIYIAIFGTNPDAPMEIELSEAQKYLLSKRQQMDFDSAKVVKAANIIQEIQAIKKRQAPLNAIVPEFNLKVLGLIDEYMTGDETKGEVKSEPALVAADNKDKTQVVESGDKNMRDESEIARSAPSARL